MPRRNKVLKSLEVIGLSIVAVLFLLATVYFLIHARGNLHTITPGEAYRSAQLDADELRQCIKTYGIRSILNLRGRNEQASWYRVEMQVSAELGVGHYDLRLSATHEPSPELVKQLLAIYHRAPQPILIHCQAGADRSGLAAAMWKVVMDGEGKREAGKQLSIVYGHLAWGGTAAMDRFFAAWRPPKQDRSG